MPKPFQYRAGSVIYFKGDPAKEVCILQKGTVNLVYQNIETGEDMHDMVQPGEFFGVKSALGRYPREENAIALQDTALMSFTVPEFEALAAANTRIILKMLKVFSNQMRRIHNQVASLMVKEETQNPEAGLFNVGQYYLKNKRYAQAKYVFGRYLTYYPSGRNAFQAAKDLEAAETAIAKSGAMIGLSASNSAARDRSDLKSIFSQPGAAQTPVDLTDTAKAYYDAVSLISQQKYQQAYMGFKRIVEDDSDPEYVAKSTFEIGRCLYLMQKFNDCIKYYTMMITKYPRHPDLGDSLYYMGQSHEKNNNKAQAAVFYRKILSMPGNEDDGTQVKARRALRALEG